MRRHIRTGVGIAVLAASAGAAAWVVYGRRHDIASTYSRIGPVAVVISLLLGLAGIGATYPVWRETSAGFGMPIPFGDGFRVFFVSQIGKYLPGSVWPALMQMEAGRRWGFTRARMLWLNLATILLSCAVGLVVAAVLLPLFGSQALSRYWWSYLILPVLLAALHPKVLPWLLDRGLVLLRRPPVEGEALALSSELRAGAWSLLSWLALGAQLAVLVVASGAHGFGPVALAVGGMSLAVPLGVLFIPAPAGAGIRDVVLLLVLRADLPSGTALAVVVGSRAILMICDVLLAGLAASLTLRRRSGAGERTRTSTPFGTRT